MAIPESVPVILTVLAVFAMTGMVLAALRELLLKYRSKSDLSKAVQSNREDVARIRVLVDQNNIDEAIDVLRKYTRKLPSNEKYEAESALSQRSEQGRASYIRDVAGSATADVA